MTTAHDYARANAGRFLDDLLTLIRIPSISTALEHADDVQRAAQWLCDEMMRIGFDNAEVLPTKGQPVAYGEWLGAGDDAPTVLVYAHYDVQPAEKSDGWNTEPFEPQVTNDTILARGASDDKGPLMAQLKAIESLMSTGGAPVNIKVMFEGEEEIGSMNMGAFIAENKERLQADVCVASDTAVVSMQQPAITYALRGLTYMELEVHGPAKDLHSGQFGGTVHNPVQAISEIIAALHRSDGSISVPGFYDDVLPLEDDERAELARLPWEESDWQANSGAPQPWGEEGYSIRERQTARPTLEINGIAGGFYGTGTMTVLPAKAIAKISCRTVANQDPIGIYELIKNHIAEITPPTVTSELRLLQYASPAYIDPNNLFVQAGVNAYKKGWGGEDAIFIRAGGSIPIVVDIQQTLGIPVVMLGFATHNDNVHGPNERFGLENFYKGIDTAIYFYQEVAARA